MSAPEVSNWVADCTAPGMVPVKVRLSPGEFLIGRDPACQLVLDGKRVSRKHARLSMKIGKDPIVEDQGSFNGTFVNGVKIMHGMVKLGEKLTVGEWTLLLRAAASADASLPLVTPLPSADDFQSGLPRTMSVPALKRVVDPQKNISSSSIPRPAGLPWVPAAARTRSGQIARHDVNWQGGEQGAGDVRQRAVGESPLLRHLTAHATPLSVATFEDAKELAALARDCQSTEELALRLVYRVAADLQSAQGEEDFLGAMADTLLQATRAQTVSLLLCPDDETDPSQLTPRAVRTVKGVPPPQGYSRSVVEQALAKKMAVATEDAREDARFANNASIMDLDLRAVLAVPMLRGDGPVGVICMTRRTPFSDAEQDLAAALGHLTALGIERARLKEKVQEEEALRRTLERFHTPEVVEKLMEKQTSHDGGPSPHLFLETITATVLFCDLCGFTSYCDQHTTAEVAILLNGYLGEMTRVVYEFHGTVDKYIGDAVMAVFGAPFPAEDDAVRAAQCALAMMEAFDQLMAERPEKERLKLRIGVNTGQVVAGTVGSPLRLEYTCLGDTVNVAQRLESIAKPGQVLVGKTTAELIRDTVKIESKGPVNLKGKAGAVETFELQAGS